MLANNAFFPPSYNRRTGSVLSYEKIIIRESFCCTTTAIKVKSGKPLLEMNQTCFVLHFEAPPSYTTERTNALEFRAKEKKQTEDAAITDTDGKTISHKNHKSRRQKKREERETTISPAASTRKRSSNRIETCV